MTAIKGYAYIIARNLIGLLLILSGAISLWRTLPFFLDRLGRQLLQFGQFNTSITNIVLDIIPIVLGIAVLRQRARGIATAYCLLGIITEAVFVFALRRYYPEHFLYLSLYVAGAIFLLIPRPRITVLNPPAEPNDRHWRRWLLASLQGEGVRPVRDRFQKGFGSRLLIVTIHLTFIVVAVLFAFPLFMGGAYWLVALVMVAVYAIACADRKDNRQQDFATF